MKTGYFDTNLVLGRAGKGMGGVLNIEGIIDACDNNNVRYGLVSHLGSLVHDADQGNDLLLKEWDKDFDKNRFFPVPVFNLNELTGKYDIKQWKEIGARAVAIGPAFYKHESGNKLKAFAKELKDSKLCLMMPLTSGYGNPPALNSPSDITSFAGSFPDIKVILTNIGRKDYGWIVKAMEINRNVYLDIGNLSTGNGIENLVLSGFEDRLICGSGFGLSYINVNRDNVIYTDLNDEIKAKILYKNAEMLFI